MNINIGWPGRVHDARFFCNSSLYQKGAQGTLFPNWSKVLCGTNVPVVVLGDPAYPLLTWLMKAYQDNGNLSSDQKNFNYCLSHARVVVEHAYGRLKGRWRCLLKRLDVAVENAPTVVAACCVLHNLCETHGDSFRDTWMESTTNDTSSNTFTSPATCTHESANNIRNAFMCYFSQQSA